jgi:hypothetical protein
MLVRSKQNIPKHGTCKGEQSYSYIHYLNCHKWKWVISLTPWERATDIHQTGSLVGPRPGLVV